MPVVLELGFGGIKVSIYFDDHDPPHVHAWAPGAEAVFNIETLEVMRYAGFSTKTLRRIQEKLTARKEQLREAWGEIRARSRR